MEKGIDDVRKDNLRYLVLNTKVTKQRQLVGVLSERFPSERGRIFIPEREYWIRKNKEIAKKPMFPGYIFALTDMSQMELHLFARRIGFEIQTYVQELSVKESELGGGAVDDGSEPWAELTAEETEFMNRMLDEQGVERMSTGYQENGRTIIMDGPLKGWEKHIVKSDRHNREAYLNISFRQCRIVAGLELKAKREFFPDGKESVGVLADGTEVDVDDLSQMMMGNGVR